ncbi:hypothetical protein M422DRAFT_253659 [Sphaerobolus stellatus SS14]|uniref:Uncharacterized protein n=1 Tax=Sphaerobolus stellatus (strain SS14) TaxID=990650 RepID=A0A0C9V808_SPHS4|nr:hypothetical protein M422DRAFT_253659 [Sphaerobolus stellatus SS14]
MINMKTSLSLLSLLAGLPTLLANPGPSIPVADAAYFLAINSMGTMSATSAGGLGSVETLPAGPQPDPLSS